MQKNLCLRMIFQQVELNFFLMRILQKNTLTQLISIVLKADGLAAGKGVLLQGA